MHVVAETLQTFPKMWQALYQSMSFSLTPNHNHREYFNAVEEKVAVAAGKP